MAAKYEDRSIGSMPGAPTGSRGLRSSPASADSGLLDDTLPPQPLKELLSAGGANLFVLSADADLIDTVQRAGGEQYPVFPVPRWEELQSAVLAGRCGIALLDADLVGAKLVDCIKALEAQSSRVVTLVAADRGVAQELMSYLSDRRIHRLLIKPANLGITKLLVESAVNRCLQLRESAGSSAGGLETLASSRATHRLSRWPRIVLAGALALGVISVGLWLVHSSTTGDRKSESVPDQAAAASDIGGRTPADSSERFTDLLSRGAQAVEAGRLSAPTGDNALDYYLTVLSMESGEPTARARLGEVVEALFAQAESALLANSLDDASAALAGVRRADPASTRLAFLEAQLGRAREAQVAAAVKTQTPAPPAHPAPVVPTELDGLLVIANARLVRGQLLDPPGDSALEYLRRAAEIDAREPRVIRERASLATALMDAVRVATDQGNLDHARRFAAAAKDLGASAEALAVVELAITAAEKAAGERRQADWLSLARSRLSEGSLLEPSGDSAFDYLRKLQADAPGSAGVSETWDDWLTALSARARQAVVTRNWSAAESTLAAMTAAPRGAAAVAPLRAQLEVERLQSQYLAQASPAGELTLLEGVPAVYPPDARRLNIQGWVELEFVVDRSGRPSDVHVVAAEPTGRFDQAALTAVAKYRYVPFERNGHVYERRVRLRVRFALN